MWESRLQTLIHYPGKRPEDDCLKALASYPSVAKSAKLRCLLEQSQNDFAVLIKVTYSMFLSCIKCQSARSQENAIVHSF